MSYYIELYLVSHANRSIVSCHILHDYHLYIHCLLCAAVLCWSDLKGHSHEQDGKTRRVGNAEENDQQSSASLVI